MLSGTPALVKYAIIRLFGDESCSTESSPDANMICAMQAVVNRALIKAFQSVAFVSVVEEAVHRCVPEGFRIDTAVEKVVDSTFLTSRVAKFINKEM